MGHITILCVEIATEITHQQTVFEILSLKISLDGILMIFCALPTNYSTLVAWKNMLYIIFCESLQTTLKSFNLRCEK